MLLRPLSETAPRPTLDCMCGRYSIIPSAEAWADLAEVLGEEIASALRAGPARYNVAPTQLVPIIVAGEDGAPTLIQARWGFIPTWWKNAEAPTLTTNARSETATSKPMWRGAWKEMRCLIPASNWYEWFNADVGTTKPLKIPHLLERADGKEILFAGLWSTFQASPDSDPLPTCTIVTLASAPDIAEIHERTPVVLNPVHWLAWLDPQLTDPAAIQHIIDTGAVEHFRMQTLETTVSNARNSGPECQTQKLWPEMDEQGKARYSKEQLLWLRKTPPAQLEREIVNRLEGERPKFPNVAERRLWVREINDRDDADSLSELVRHIRDTLKVRAVIKPTGRSVPGSDQGSLF